MGDDIIATNGRKTSGIAVDIERIDHIVYGMNEEKSDSTFIDAGNLQDASEENCRFGQRKENRDYSVFGKIRTITY